MKASVVSCWLQNNFHFSLALHCKNFSDLMVAKQHLHHSHTSDIHTTVYSTIDKPYSGTSTNPSEVSWPYPALNEDVY